LVSLAKQFIFDQSIQSELRDAKGEFLRRVITPWKSAPGLQTAFDTGCGVGYFSGVLQDLGLRVSAAENVQNYGVAELVISAKWRALSRDRLIRAVVASIVKGSSKK